MRLAIMQPYFFPYLGHFSLIAACDEWIVFDISQYAPRNWMNRNRILHPGGGWKWLTVPLANSSIHIRTDQARILDADATRSSMLAHLSHYRGAPYYRSVIALVEEVFAPQGSSLVDLNVRALATVCRHVGLPFRHRICSDLALDLPVRLGPGEWAPEMCAALGATGYVNPIGGQDLFDSSDFARRGIELTFLKPGRFDYVAGRFRFEPDLSILDVLMWNRPDAVLAAVCRFDLVRPAADDAPPERGLARVLLC